MLTRTVKGPLREVWVEDDPNAFDGGADLWFETGINPTERNREHPEIDYVEIYLYVDAVVGSPVIPDPTAEWAADGHLRVRAQNTAAAGNGAAYTLDIRLNHSIGR